VYIRLFESRVMRINDGNLRSILTTTESIDLEKGRNFSAR